MTRIGLIDTDLIRVNPSNPCHSCSIVFYHKLATSKLERRPPLITRMRFEPVRRFNAALGATIVSFLPFGVTLAIAGGVTITPLTST